MSRIPELKNERDYRIREKYKELAEKKIGNTQLYRHDAILEMLSKKFYLSTSWIERIVSGNTGAPYDPNQTKLFE